MNTRAFSKKVMMAFAVLAAFVFVASKPWKTSTTLAEAVCEGNFWRTLNLLRDGANPNIVVVNATEETTPLLSALDNVSCPKLLPSLWTRVLVTNGADVNFPGGSGYTPLMMAVGLSDVWAVAYLLDSGADINKQDNNGHTALMLAVELNSAPMVKGLLVRGNIIGIKNYKNETAIDIARTKGYNEIYALLLEHDRRDKKH